MDCWKGNIFIQDGQTIHDIHLSSPSITSTPLPTEANLQFLSLVDTSRLPLHIAFGPRLDVWTTEPDTERWFSSLLLGQPATSGIKDGEEELAWWQTARIESPLGILVSVNGQEEASGRNARATEVLFFLSRDIDATKRPPTPPRSSSDRSQRGLRTTEGARLHLHAFTLSSDLLFPKTDDLTPPPSPSASSVDGTEGVFLPFPAYEPLESAVGSKKRKGLIDTFDAAAEARKRAKRRPNQSNDPSAAYSQLDQRRSVSGPNSLREAAQCVDHSTKQRKSSLSSVPLQTRPLSRSPSLSGSRPPSRRVPPTTAEAPKRSNLSRVESVSAAPDEATETESKNKDLVSRLVMAGMRLYGLSQSKSRKSRRGSMAQTATSQSQFVAVEDTQMPDEENARDEEYKLIYHQVYKGACFTFRAHMNSVSLNPYTEKLRETVDRLLALFCNDPLAQGLPGLDETLTPGGRKAFGTDKKDEEEANTFSKPTEDGANSEANTPSWRKLGKAKASAAEAVQTG